WAADSSGVGRLAGLIHQSGGIECAVRPYQGRRIDIPPLGGCKRVREVGLALRGGPLLRGPQIVVPGGRIGFFLNRQAGEIGKAVLISSGDEDDALDEPAPGGRTCGST